MSDEVDVIFLYVDDKFCRKANRDTGIDIKRDRKRVRQGERYTHKK